MRTLLTYSEVEAMLMERGRLRQRQARAVLKHGHLPPHPHKLHTRRLWLLTRVEAYCEQLKLGEGV